MEPRATTPSAPTRDVGHLVRQAVLLLSSGVVSYGGAFVVSVMLARTLGATGYGGWVIGFAISQTIATLGLLGTDWVIVRQGAYYQGTGDERRLRKTIHHCLAISGTALMATAVVLFAAATPIADRVFHDPGLVGVLRISAVLGLVVGIGNVMLYGTQAFKSMRESALVRASRPVITLALVGGALLAYPTVTAAFASLLASECVLTALATLSLHRRVALLGPTLPIEKGQFVRLGAPAWGNRVVERVRVQVFPLLLGSLNTVSASGVFSANRRIAAAPGAILGSLNQIYTPMASDAFLRGRRDDVDALYKSVGKWRFALTVPLFALIVAFPGDVLSLFGAAFRAQTAPLVLLSIGMLVNSATGPGEMSLLVIGRAHLALIDYLIVFVLEAGLAVWLIPAHGVMGAAIAAFAGTTVNNVLAVIQVWLAVHMHPYRFDYWKPAVAGVAALAVTKVVLGAIGHPASPIVLLLIAAIVLGVVYLAGLLAVGITDDDREAIRALLFRRRRRVRAAVAVDPAELPQPEQRRAVAAGGED